MHTRSTPGEAEPKVWVPGLGYIGLPTAAAIARTGARVPGVDVGPEVLETVNSGRVHIEEVNLDGLVSGAVARGTLRASLDVEPADVFVIAVPTPPPPRRRVPAGHRPRAARRHGSEAGRHGDPGVHLARRRHRAGPRPAGGAPP